MLHSGTWRRAAHGPERRGGARVGQRGRLHRIAQRRAVLQNAFRSRAAARRLPDAVLASAADAGAARHRRLLQVRSRSTAFALSSHNSLEQFTWL